MNIFFIITYTTIITLALIYGFKKHIGNRKDYKTFIDSLSLEERQTYYEKLDQQRIDYFEKLRNKNK